VVIEEIGDEGQIEFGVAGDKRGGGQEFAAVELISVGEDLFGTLVQVAGL